MEYMTTQQAAQKWNISRRRVQILCTQGRIKGAFRIGDVWAIPQDAEKPTDARYKSSAKDITVK